MEKKPHPFCETPEENCTMNYCDDNGCQNRKRELVNPELTQLKAENKALVQTVKDVSDLYHDTKAENERLKAEIAELKLENKGLYECIEDLDRNH